MSEPTRHAIDLRSAKPSHLQSRLLMRKRVLQRGPAQMHKNHAWHRQMASKALTASRRGPTPKA